MRTAQGQSMRTAQGQSRAQQQQAQELHTTPPPPVRVQHDVQTQSHTTPPTHCTHPGVSCHGPAPRHSSLAHARERSCAPPPRFQAAPQQQQHLQVKAQRQKHPKAAGRRRAAQKCGRWGRHGALHRAERGGRLPATPQTCPHNDSAQSRGQFRAHTPTKCNAHRVETPCRWGAARLGSRAPIDEATRAGHGWEDTRVF